jgi:hypothetical protein
MGEGEMQSRPRPIRHYGVVVMPSAAEASALCAMSILQAVTEVTRIVVALSNQS